MKLINFNTMGLEKWGAAKEKIMIKVCSKQELGGAKKVYVKEYLDLYLMLMLEMRAQDNTWLYTLGVDETDLKRWGVPMTEIEITAYANMRKEMPVIKEYRNSKDEFMFYMVSVMATYDGEDGEPRTPKTVLLRRDVLKSIADKADDDILLMERRLDTTNNSVMCALPFKKCDKLEVLDDKAFALEKNASAGAYVFSRKTSEVTVYKDINVSLRQYLNGNNIDSNGWIET